MYGNLCPECGAPIVPGSSWLDLSPQLCYDPRLAIKQVLKVLVEINEREHGRYQRLIDSIHLELDNFRVDNDLAGVDTTG